MVSFLIYDFMAIKLFVFVLNREESSLFKTNTNNFQDPGVIETGQVTSAKYAYPFFNLLVKKLQHGNTYESTQRAIVITLVS